MRPDERDLAHVVESKDRGALGLGKLAKERIELGDRVLRRQPREDERAHRSPGTHCRHVDQGDGLLQLVDTGLHTLGDDRIGAVIVGDVEARHRLLGRLGLLALLVGDPLLDPLAHQRLERRHEIAGLGVTHWDDLDRISCGSWPVSSTISLGTMSAGRCPT